MRLFITSMMIFSLCAGCASQKPLYQWGSYEDALYASYKNPEKSKEYHETLRRMIEWCEKRGEKIPPGICADYGYGLYVEGKLDEAISFFEKERDLWPESAVLMNTLIGNVAKLKSGGDRNGDTAAAEPAPAISED